uniref:Dynamin-related protein 3A-like n=1 Tax=Rhizophora mucronata TaxID=61149 RepID=A0A2P2JTA0_RHIMU
MVGKMQETNKKEICTMVIRKKKKLKKLFTLKYILHFLEELEESNFPKFLPDSITLPVEEHHSDQLDHHILDNCERISLLPPVHL